MDSRGNGTLPSVFRVWFLFSFYPDRVGPVEGGAARVFCSIHPPPVPISGCASRQVAAQGRCVGHGFRGRAFAQIRSGPNAVDGFAPISESNKQPSEKPLVKIAAFRLSPPFSVICFKPSEIPQATATIFL